MRFFKTFYSQVTDRTPLRICVLKTGLFLVFILGLGARLAYFSNDDFRNSYVNDMGDHLPVIRWMYLNRDIPRVIDGGGEMTQQPLYYIIAACVMAEPNPDLINDTTNLDRLAFLGTIISSGALTFIYLAAFFLSSWLARYASVIYAGLAPFMILHSTCIGNDGMVLFSASGVYYFMLRLNRRPTSQVSFWGSILFVILALFSKLNCVAVLVAVPWILWRATRGWHQWRVLLFRGWVFSVIFSFWFFVTILRCWNPDIHEFRLMNFFGGLPNQVPVSVSFFTTFNFVALEENGQASIEKRETTDGVRFSYNTFLYGEFVLGAWDYRPSPTVQWVNRVLLLNALFVPLGLFIFIGYALVRFRRDILSVFKGRWRLVSILSLTALGVICASWTLDVRLMITSPYSFNEDPRYFCPCMPWIFYSFSRGLTVFRDKLWFNRACWAGVLAFVPACLVYLYFLLTLNQIAFRYY